MSLHCPEVFHYRAVGGVLSIWATSGVISLSGIEKSFGPVRAVAGVTIDIELFHQSPQAAAATGRVGAMLQDGGLMTGVLVGELLAMLAAQYPSPMGVRAALSVSNLDGLEGRRVDRLSGGEVQRLRAACAIIGNPELLVLDEPTVAMDVEARRAFWVTMRERAANGRTVLFSTHCLNRGRRVRRSSGGNGSGPGARRWQPGDDQVGGRAEGAALHHGPA